MGNLISKKNENFENIKSWKFEQSTNWYAVLTNGYSISMSQTGITLPTRKYSIAFMYTLQQTSPYWNNIFHITNTQLDWGADGCRIPAMWVIPGTTYFHLRFGTENNYNDGIDTNNYQIRPINIGEQVMIVLTFDNNICSIYYDGVKVFSNTFNNITQIKPSATLYIGNPWHNNNGKLHVKNFTIYNDVLSPSEIYDIYTNKIKGDTGPAGPTGPTGPTGPAGPPGPAGSAFKSFLKPNATIDKNINRILTNKNTYAYCLGGTISCNNGNLDKINDDYKYGSTYNYKCSNGTQAYCSNGILESNKNTNGILESNQNINGFKFSNSYKGFTLETKDSPYVYDLSSNRITYNNNSYMASEDICNFLNKDSRSKNCYMPY